MAAAAAAGGLYVHLGTDGDSCESAGLLYIETKEECEDAAASLQLADTDATSESVDDWPYGCYATYDGRSLYSNNAISAKGTVWSGYFAICKTPTSPEPLVGYAAPGWVAFNNFLTAAVFDTEYDKYEDRFSWFHEPQPGRASLSGYAALQLTQGGGIVLIIIILVIGFVFIIYLLLLLGLVASFVGFYVAVSVLAMLVLSIIGVCSPDRKCCDQKQSDEFHALMSPLLNGLEYVWNILAKPAKWLKAWIKKQDELQERGHGARTTAVTPAGQQTGWAERTSSTRLFLHQFGLFLLVPLVVTQITLLDSHRFVFDNADIVIAPCTNVKTSYAQDGGAYTQDESGSGLPSETLSERYITAPSTYTANPSLKFRHEGICQAVADEYDCFATNRASTLRTIIQSEESYRSRKHIAKNQPLTCSSDGFVDLVDTCEQPQEIKCFKLHDQMPMDWLDALGIAAGVIGLLVYIFDNLDWLLGIGKAEPNSTPWCWGKSTIRLKRAWFVRVCMLSVLLLVGLSFFSITKRTVVGKFAVEDMIASYAIPVLFISTWMFQCTRHVWSFDSGTCRYTILVTLFGTYAEDFSNDDSRAATATSKHWTPASTARLLKHVKKTVMFPDLDEAMQLDAYELSLRMDDFWRKRKAQKHELKQDSDMREKLKLRAKQGTPLQNADIAIPVTATADSEANVEHEREARIQKEMEAVRAIFDSVDANEDGKVSKQELATALNTDAHLTKQLEDAGIAVDSDAHIFGQIDTNKDELISFPEFEAAIDGWKLHGDYNNFSIFVFVCAIKRVPAKVEAYRNPKYPAGTLSFGEVWEATWDTMINSQPEDSKNAGAWWKLGIVKQNRASSDAGAAGFGFPGPDIVVVDGNNNDGINADGNDERSGVYLDDHDDIDNVRLNDERASVACCACFCLLVVILSVVGTMKTLPG